MNKNSTLFEGIADIVEIASDFGVTVRTIRNYVNEPDGLPSIKVGKKRYFILETSRKWLMDREAQRNPIVSERRGRRRA